MPLPLVCNMRHGTAGCRNAHARRLYGVVREEVHRASAALYRRVRTPATEEARRALGSVQERCKLSQRGAAVERLQQGLEPD